MRLVLGSMLLGIGAMLVLGVGIWGAVWVGLQVRARLGYEWELAGFFAPLLVLTAIAYGMYHWQDALMGMLGPLLARPPEDHLCCQVCGRLAPADSLFCAACGGTRFGIAPPGSAGAAWHLQVEMDVVGADGAVVGVVKRRRADGVLVSRPWRRDVCVPFEAIARAEARSIRLRVPAAAVRGDGRQLVRAGLLRAAVLPESFVFKEGLLGGSRHVR